MINSLFARQKKTEASSVSLSRFRRGLKWDFL